MVATCAEEGADTGRVRYHLSKKAVKEQRR